MNSLPRPPKNKALLSLAVTIAIVGGVECGLRIFGFRFERREIPLVLWNAEQDKQFDSLKALHRTDPHCMWVPQPRAAIPWATGEGVNIRGYRGRMLELAPESPPFRVAFLGDSSTFGWGVNADHTYAAISSKFLEDEGIPTESLNAGVVGYTIAQGVARYRELVRAHEPDVVVVAFGAINDILNGPGQESDRTKIQKLEADDNWIGRLGMFCRDHLRVVQLVSWLRFRRDGGEEALDNEYRNKMKAEPLYLTDLEKIGRSDYPGVRRVSLTEFRDYLDELVSAIRADGARPILVSLPRMLSAEEDFPALADYSQATEQAAERQGVPLVDLHEHFRSFGVQNERQLFFDYWHPKKRAHRLIAEDLHPLLKELAAECGHPR